MSILPNQGLLFLRKIAVITIASLIYGTGISLFLDPNQLAPGGISGISIILGHIFGGDTGMIYLLLNIPLLVLGFVKFGSRFMALTVYSVFSTSLACSFFARFAPVTHDLVLASLAGGCLLALGIGLTFRAGATTGGSDILIKYLRTHFRHLKTGFLFQCFDVAVVTISALVFRNIEVALYAMLTALLCGKALDFVLYGGDEARLIYIITEHPEAIGRRLLEEIDTGYTYLQGSGGYTDRPKRVILCVVQKKMGPRVQEIVKSEDPAAFMILSSANEIYGEGYKDLFAEQL